MSSLMFPGQEWAHMGSIASRLTPNQFVSSRSFDQIKKHNMPKCQRIQLSQLTGCSISRGTKIAETIDAVLVSESILEI